MNNCRKFSSRAVLFCLLLCLLCGCAKNVPDSTPAASTPAETPHVTAAETEAPTKATEAPTAAPTVPSTEAVKPYEDIAGKVKLNLSSSSRKQEVSVKAFVDGDTTHFNVPENVMEGGVLKARYLAVNTPESTGKVEEYGKTASLFTRDKLEHAVSILVESDDENWNPDSTSTRYLVWVWYKPEGGEYRNLNIELLQNGLAIANSSAQNRYGSFCQEAIQQARSLKLNIFSGEKDPNFFYGDAIELTLKELRCNIEKYKDQKVAFEAVIIRNSNNSVYLEEYDEATGLYQGISLYYGFGLSGDGLNILTVGNRARIVGTVQFYETGGTWQVAGPTYKAMKPKDPGNIQKLGEGYTPAYTLTSADTFLNGKVEVDLGGDDVRTFDYPELAMNTSLEMHGLKVKSIYTTVDEESSSKNAMTLSCECDGLPITVRTTVLYDEDRNVITAAAYEGRTINVKGQVDLFDGNYQIKVFTAKDITIVE